MDKDIKTYRVRFKKSDTVYFDWEEKGRVRFENAVRFAC